MRKSTTGKANTMNKTFLKNGMLTTTAIVAGVLMCSSSAYSQTATPSNSWDYDSVVDGNVSKDTSVAGITNINVTGGNGYVDGNADIYSGHTVNVTGDTGTTFAYRDNRDTIISRIDGNLNSNIRVVVIDKNGLFFTENAKIDVNSIIATTGVVNRDDLMDGNDTLEIMNVAKGAKIINDGMINAEKSAILVAEAVENNGTIVTKAGGDILLAAANQIRLTDDGSGFKQTRIDVAENGMVINTGTLNAGNAGLAAIVSPFAVNNGVIKAKAGTAVLAAGEVVTLDMYGDGLVEVAVEGELKDALIQNKGEIRAAGGTVNITAQAAKNTVDDIINNQGIISASSATVEGGKIILNGGESGTVANNGKIRTNNGPVTVSGERFVQGNTPVPGVKPAINSKGGDIEINTSGDVELLAGKIKAEGGDITIDNGGTFKSVSAETLKTENAGTITLNQNEGGSIQNAINAIDNDGTGLNTINVGAGEYHEAVRADVENLALLGANEGVAGDDSANRGAESTIIPNSPGVFIVADNVTVDGFEIVGGESGVRLQNADNAQILNNNIRDQYHGAGIGLSYGGFATGDGIFVQNSEGTLIDGNKIQGMNDDGIHAVDVTDLTITNNVIIDDGVTGDISIAVAGALGTTIIDNNNIIGSRRHGVEVRSSTGDVQITNNDISQSGDDGVHVENSQFIDINNNTISFSKDDGIDVDQSAGAQITDNNILLADDNGIEIANSPMVVASNDLVAISRNKIGTVGGNGIDAENVGLFTNINANEVFGVAQDAINVRESSSINIFENKVGFAGDDGIDVSGSPHANIYDNEVLTVGDNGIELEDSAFSDVMGNIISLTGRDSINISNSNLANVNGNTLSFAAGDGIDVEGGSMITIEGNDILLIDDNGIEISDAEDVTVNANDIGSIGDNGIEIVDSNIVQVNGNTIAETGDDGIDLNDVNGATISENNIELAEDDGIDIDGGSEITIEENNILKSSDDGISISEAEDVLVYGNVIAQSGDDGVDVEYTDFVEIDENTITESGDDGVDVYSTSLAVVTNNVITESVDNGIYVGSDVFSTPVFFERGSVETAKVVSSSFGSTAIIEGNDVSESGANGIQIENIAEAEINDNILTDNGENGLYVSGAFNGYVGVEGNDFTNNGGEEFAQALFESGDIDLSNELNPNTFTHTNPGTNVAMRFEDVSAFLSPPSITPVSIFDQEELSSEAVISLSTGNGLRIVDETLGATEFTGYTDAGNFYVRFEDGSILDPITNSPIVIDGSNASFDAIVPSSFAGATLPIATLQFIEDRLYDADDVTVNGRGQIFVGFPELITGPANFQDFLPEFEDTTDQTSSASLTITNLPSIGNFDGGTDGLNDIEPAGGNGEGQNPADIEPAAGEGAGEQQVTCLGDAVNSLGSGAVTYNFGGSFEDSIASASGCQTSPI